MTLMIGYTSCVSAEDATITPEEYEEYLAGLGDSESSQLKEQLSKIPRTKKQKLLKYFSSPEMIKMIYSQDVPPNSRKILYNGDVILEDKSTISEQITENNYTKKGIGSCLSSLFINNIFAAPRIREFSATHVKQIDLLGTYLRLTVNVKYRVANGKVSHILTGSATEKRFLWMSEVTRKAFSKYIMGNKARGAATWAGATILLKN